MKFLLLSDMHGDTAYVEKLAEQFAEADAVLFAGDFAAFEHPETGLPALDTLVKKHEVIFSVIGNCDTPDFIEEIEKQDISVEKSLVFHGGLVFTGSGGGSRFTGTTPNERSDEELLSDLDIVTNSATQGADEKGHWNNLVVIMHNPPKDTNCDVISAGVHVGSALLRSFIEKIEPLFVLTGHIHESAGIDRIGKTVVINPGSLAEGRYGWMEAQEDSGCWQVTTAELRSL
jgi:uncharacterized protein